MRKLTTRSALVFIVSARALVPTGHLAGQERASAWSVAVTTSLASFRGAASNGSGPSNLAVRPGQGIALGLAATRRWGPWALSLGAVHLPTHIEAVSSEIAVQERSQDLERVRLAVTIAREVTRLGTGRLEVRATPTLDNWSVNGEDGRSVVGGEAAVALQLPAGPVILENALGFGWSPGPFRTDELPDGYRRRGLRAVTAGIGIRLEL